ncbi:hypothetical protein V8F20_003481 [Naviculisporaceae sp. PSN 640]
MGERTGSRAFLYLWPYVMCWRSIVPYVVSFTPPPSLVGDLNRAKITFSVISPDKLLYRYTSLDAGYPLTIYAFKWRSYCIKLACVMNLSDPQEQLSLARATILSQTPFQRRCLDVSRASTARSDVLLFTCNEIPALQVPQVLNMQTKVTRSTAAILCYLNLYRICDGTSKGKESRILSSSPRLKPNPLHRCSPKRGIDSWALLSSPTTMGRALSRYGGKYATILTGSQLELPFGEH